MSEYMARQDDNQIEAGLRSEQRLLEKLDAQSKLIQEKDAEINLLKKRIKELQNNGR